MSVFFRKYLKLGHWIYRSLKYSDVDETWFMVEYDRTVTKDQSLVLGSKKRRVITCLQVFPKTNKIRFKSNERFKMVKKTISSLT